MLRYALRAVLLTKLNKKA